MLKVSVNTFEKSFIPAIVDARYGFNTTHTTMIKCLIEEMNHVAPICFACYRNSLYFSLLELSQFACFKRFAAIGDRT